jgi:hypothetical protein
MKKSLLVCVAFHYNPDRLQYLNKVVDNIILNYPKDTDIIIDTNVEFVNNWHHLLNIDICAHTNLTHPFHLAWQHRKHILRNIEDYDNFAYFEDDTLLPYENYLNYLENFKLLFPQYVPAMIRIEEKGGEQFVTDIIEPQEQVQTLDKLGRFYSELKAPNNYNGFWIMPAKDLKWSMISNFDRVHQSREHAASYVAWELQKPTMIQIEDGVVSEKCYAYHLPNNYSKSPESKNAKLNPKNIFQ